MTTPNKTKIARILHAERKGKVSAKGGYFGALQLLADVNKRKAVEELCSDPSTESWIQRELRQALDEDAWRT
jgi:hypothetical protein